MGFGSCVIGADLWSFGPLDILDGKLYGGISYKRANFTVGQRNMIVNAQLTVCPEEALLLGSCGTRLYYDCRKASSPC
jgi:hypothetical protein